MTKKKNMIPKLVLLPVNMLAAAVKLAGKRELTFSQVVRNALSEHIARENRR